MCAREFRHPLYSLNAGSFKVSEDPVSIINFIINKAKAKVEFRRRGYESKQSSRLEQVVVGGRT